MCVVVVVVVVVVVDDDDVVLGVVLNKFLFRVSLHKIACITGKDSSIF